MSESNSISAEMRGNAGKGHSRRLRVDGRMPAIIYGGTNEPVEVSLSIAEFIKEYKRPGFFTRLYDLNINQETLKVLPREVQLHPLTDAPLHADFLRYVKGSEIAVAVSVKFIGQEECEGLKRGGVINIVRHEVELMCPVESIPDELVADISGLNIGDSVHISAISLPEGVAPTITDRDFTVATIAAPTIHVEEVEEEGDEETEEVEGLEEVQEQTDQPAGETDAESDGTES